MVRSDIPKKKDASNSTCPAHFYLLYHSRHHTASHSSPKKSSKKPSLLFSNSRPKGTFIMHWPDGSLCSIYYSIYCRILRPLVTICQNMTGQPVTAFFSCHIMITPLSSEWHCGTSTRRVHRYLFLQPQHDARRFLNFQRPAFIQCFNFQCWMLSLTYAVWRKSLTIELCISMHLPYPLWHCRSSHYGRRPFEFVAQFRFYLAMQWLYQLLCANIIY
jgi:hypothetical protein